MKHESPIIILVAFAALFFVIHQYFQMYLHLPLTFIDSYLDPAVLMPLILYVVLWERRILLRNKSLVLTYVDILGYFVLMVFFGEILCPMISERFTADFWDILAYAVGTLAYVIAKEISKLIKFRHYKSLFSRYI